MSSTVTGRVVSCPWTTFPSESPTRMMSIPTWSRFFATRKSYPVSIAIFSPVSFMRSTVLVVTTRGFGSTGPLDFIASSPRLCLDRFIRHGKQLALSKAHSPLQFEPFANRGGQCVKVDRSADDFRTIDRLLEHLTPDIIDCRSLRHKVVGKA